MMKKIVFMKRICFYGRDSFNVKKGLYEIDSFLYEKV